MDTGYWGTRYLLFAIEASFGERPALGRSLAPRSCRCLKKNRS